MTHMHGRRQFGLRGLMLTVTLLAVLLGVGVSLGPRAAFYIRCHREGLPRDLWGRLWQRHKRGWTLRSWKRAAGSGPQLHVLVFLAPLEQHPNGLFQREVRWRDADGSHTWVGDATTYAASWSKPRWNDLDRDGRPELVVDYSQGGNCWQCSRIEVFRLDNNSLVPLNLPLHARQGVDAIKDLDGDRVSELIVLDSNLEFFGNRSHADGLAVRRIFHWDSDADSFVDVSPQFPKFHRQALADSLDDSRVSERFRNDPWHVTMSRARALAAAAVYRWCIGDIEQGWKEYDSALSKLLVEGEHPGPYPLRASLIKERQELAELFFGDARR
jgi:hypothetical protein